MFATLIKLNFGPALVSLEMTNEGDVNAYFNENSECDPEVSDMNCLTQY